MKQFISVILFCLLICTAGWAQTDDKLPTKEFRGITFFQVDITPLLRVYLRQEEYKQYKKDGAPEFTNKFSKAIDLLSSHNIPLPKIGYYQFLILPKGEIYRKIADVSWSEGIGGINGWPEALAADHRCFLALHPKSPFIGLVHELAHLVHGDWLEITPICEGFAEVVPFYMLDLKDEKQQNLALNLKRKEIYSVNTLIKRGMFLEGDMQAQYRKTYISMYLWMRGYLEILQQKYNFDKLQALNFILQEFKNAAALPTLEEQENYIARLIGWKRKKLFDGNTLQLLGQKSLKKAVSDK